MYYGIVKIILEQTDLDALLGETTVKKTKYTVALNLIHWSASASTTLTKEEEVTQMCSLLKFHEEGIPTRPIVFTINLTTCTDVKELAHTLTPTPGHSTYMVRNSTAFVARTYRLH